MLELYKGALSELGDCLGAIDPAQFDAAVAQIAQARRLALYGVGREGLQIKGLAMRLFHLGLQASVVGDMTTPPIGAGDLLIVSAGPGYFSTVAALIDVARDSGADVLLVTAEPGGVLAERADRVLVIPAQTMARDRGDRQSVLPMGSLYEGAQYLAFELLVLAVRDRTRVTAEAMRANHTNLE